jgi:hypothetical protein
MRVRLAALIFASCAVATFAQAQDAKVTKIHATFQVFSHRLTPSPGWQGIVMHDVTLTLSGRGDIHEVQDFSDGKNRKHHDLGQALGVGPWRVVGPHILERRRSEPQSVNIIRIEVSGTNCQASWEERLNPGAQSYVFESPSTGRIESYSEQRMVSSACAIE